MTTSFVPWLEVPIRDLRIAGTFIHSGAPQFAGMRKPYGTCRTHR